MSVICVLGATGSQGGSVCAALQQNPKWAVRAITRNPAGASAKKLLDQGIEVVAADANDEASLVKAFEATSAVFALTNYNWETVVKSGRDAAGEEEKTQQINIANAAAKTPTLRHYVMSSLPPASVVSDGALKVPHFDYKHAAYQWIEANHPDLALKTTQIWLGWYPTNMAYNPMTKMIPVPGSDAHIWLQPNKPDAILPIGGDVQHNVGVVVEGVLEAGLNVHGKIAIIITDYLKISEVVKVWESLTGKKGVYLELPDEQMQQIWGVAGEELASQLRWSERYPSWHDLFPEKVITFSQLGVEGKIRNLKQALENIKDAL
ncbi:hypothetical protein B0T10DRAFT_419748 [Thelonectria olida]|uniref:NmrA-like domain-containing protein n=1 Tax=Thelonectria olida TaxID=1576542 RepID=A0A9P8VQU5_9HYPO|nr:hypothetical protein B0T10DRAFT_419748 [Thelonectria olida]